jgi:hypothetical protein
LERWIFISSESTKLHQILAKPNDRVIWQFYKDDSEAVANVATAPRHLPAIYKEHVIFLATQFALLQHRQFDTVINLIKHSELMMWQNRITVQRTPLLLPTRRKKRNFKILVQTSEL